MENMTPNNKPTLSGLGAVIKLVALIALIALAILAWPLTLVVLGSMAMFPGAWRVLTGDL